MAIDDRLQKHLTEIVDARESIRDMEKRLRPGGGGPTSGAMDQRVTRLETHMEYVREDMSEIKASLASIAASVDGLKQDTRDAKLAALSAQNEASAAKSHSAGKATVITTGIGAVLAILGTMLAVLAFGGDRFDGGLNASGIADQAASKAVASAAAAAKADPSVEPWANDPVVPVAPPAK